MRQWYRWYTENGKNHEDRTQMTEFWRTLLKRIEDAANFLANAPPPAPYDGYSIETSYHIVIFKIIISLGFNCTAHCQSIQEPQLLSAVL